VLDIALRTVMGFAVLLVLTRVLGKKQLSQLTVFTYITGIVLGEIIGEIIMDKEKPFLHGVLALVIWCTLVLLIEFISMKNTTARVIMDGEPAIVIKHGQIMEQSLKKHRLNLDDLSMQLRLNQVFSIMDVEYAILEPNGALTVMKKPGKESVTKEDMNIIPGPALLPAEIICDGKIVEKNLKELDYPRETLYNDLFKHGVVDVRAVLYAELQGDRSLHVQKK